MLQMHLLNALPARQIDEPHSRKADVPCRSFQHCRIEKLLSGTIVCSIESKGNPCGLRLWFTGEGFTGSLSKFGEDAEGHAENG